MNFAKRVLILSFLYLICAAGIAGAVQRTVLAEYITNWG